MILKTVDLGINFGSLLAVNQVSLEIEEGETRAIIGPNGAGKTTLINLLTNRLRASSGKIIFKGKDVTHLLPCRLAAIGIGRCFQICNLYPGLSVFENIQIAAISRYGKSLNFISSGNNILKDVVHDTLKAIGLEHIATELAGNLSFGDQKRLDVGITLAIKPELLLLDEPTAGVSPLEGLEIMQLIKELTRQQSVTVIFVEHDMNIVFNYADKVTVMDLGRTIFTGTPAEVRESEIVQRVYLGTGA